MANGGRTPDQLRGVALLALDKRVVHLETTALELIRLLDEAVRRLKTQMFGGMGYKGETLSREDVELLKAVTASFNSATDAQIRLDKTAEVRKNAMTHEEQKAELATWVLSWPSNSERADWIRDIARRHDAGRTGVNTTRNNSLELGATLAGVREDAPVELP